MEKLDKYMMYEIFYFVSNDALMKLLGTNKEIRDLLWDKRFKSIIIHRKHPIVFNVLHNFCSKCNFFSVKRYHIYFNPLKTMSCYHTALGGVS
jgi:hypothetical protein